jgi:hypothetical protein
MLKKQLILKDPLGFLGYETDDIDQQGNFGAVTSRAGVGKTAFLVQIAISSLLKDKRVLHIGIQDPVDKVNLWYREMFSNLTQDHDAKQSRQLWESLLVQRFIMTFETESFDLTKLISRIDELIAQHIFIPQVLILDGLSIDTAMPSELNRLKEYARQNHFIVWFSIRSHRHHSDDPVGMLRQWGGNDPNLFNMFIQLLPDKDKIQVKRLSLDREINDRPPLFLDPSTMMIKETPEG